MSDEEEAGFRSFERFIDEWSRRDFLRRVGAGTAFAAFMAGGGAFLEACGGTRSQGSATPTPGGKKGGHIVEGTIADLKSLNPVLVSDTVSALCVSMIYDSLYQNDFNALPLPLLAKSLPQISSDNMTYTITLGDAKWSDGQPVTADDVKFTYDLMWAPQYKAVNSPRRSDLEQYVKNITVKDSKTIVFELTQVYAPFISAQLEFGILPKHIWGSMAPDAINTTPLNSAPTVTNGPFGQPNWQKGTQITFTSNKSYHRGAPNIDTWVLKVVPQATQLLNQLKTGEIDIANGLDPSQYDAAVAVTDLETRSYASLSFLFYYYNLDPTKSKLFQDKRVRQGLLYALDRKAMAKAIYFDQATVANSSEPPPSWAYAPVQPVYNFDKAKAQQLLDDAGFKTGADGIRANGDLKLQFQMLTNKGNNARESMLTAMQNQWKDIGVDATPNPVDFNLELVPQITNKRTFQVLLVGFSWDVDPDQSAVFSSANAAAGGFNGADYKNPDLDKVLNQAVSTLDKTKRKQLYKQAQQIIAEDVPAPILLFANDIVVTNKRVQGFKPNAYANRYGGRTRYILDVYVTDGK